MSSVLDVKSLVDRGRRNGYSNIIPIIIAIMRHGIQDGQHLLDDVILIHTAFGKLLEVDTKLKPTNTSVKDSVEEYFTLDYLKNQIRTDQYPFQINDIRFLDEGGVAKYSRSQFNNVDYVVYRLTQNVRGWNIPWLLYNYLNGNIDADWWPQFHLELSKYLDMM